MALASRMGLSSMDIDTETVEVDTVQLVKLVCLIIMYYDTGCDGMILNWLVYVGHSATSRSDSVLSKSQALVGERTDRDVVYRWDI